MKSFLTSELGERVIVALALTPLAGWIVETVTLFAPVFGLLRLEPYGSALAEGGLVSPFTVAVYVAGFIVSYALVGEVMRRRVAATFTPEHASRQALRVIGRGILLAFVAPVGAAIVLMWLGKHAVQHDELESTAAVLLYATPVAVVVLAFKLLVWPLLGRLPQSKDEDERTEG